MKDLVHFVLRHRRKNAAKPTGIADFQRILKESKLPVTIVPWNKVFDRKQVETDDEEDEIQKQHGRGKIKR